MKTVLVTGATGFVGRCVCARLSENGWRVRGATRGAAPTKDFSPSVAEWVSVGEIGPQTDWSYALNGVDAVVHLAALAHQTDPRKQPTEAQFFAANAEGTRGLAQSVRATASVKHFVFMSSIGAVCDASETLITGETIPAPSTPYGRSKLAAENALREVFSSSEIRWSALRPVLVYGPGNPGNMARLLRLVRTGIPLPLGALHNRRSFVFVENLADAVFALLETKRSLATAFAVADAEVVSTPELISQIAGATGRRARLWSAPDWFLKLAAKFGDLLAACGVRIGIDSYSLLRLSQSLEVSTEPLRAATGWRPRHRLEEGLRRSLVS